MEDAEVVLRRAPLFDGLDDESVRTLRRQTSEVKIARGEHLFLEGQDGDRLYVVLEGKIKLTRAAVDGRENLWSVLGPGEMVGELSLFDPRPRTSTASAVTDATVAALAHDALRPWQHAQPRRRLERYRSGHHRRARRRLYHLAPRAPALPTRSGRRTQPLSPAMKPGAPGSHRCISAITWEAIPVASAGFCR